MNSADEELKFDDRQKMTFEVMESYSDGKLEIVKTEIPEDFNEPAFNTEQGVIDTEITLEEAELTLEEIELQSADEGLKFDDGQEMAFEIREPAFDVEEKTVEEEPTPEIQKSAPIIDFNDDEGNKRSSKKSFTDWLDSGK